MVSNADDDSGTLAIAIRRGEQTKSLRPEDINPHRWGCFVAEGHPQIDRRALFMNARLTAAVLGSCFAVSTTIEVGQQEDNERPEDWRLGQIQAACRGSR